MFVVIFEVRPGEGKRDDYLEHAKELKPEIEQIDGFIDNERFESRHRAGWVLSLSTWRDEKSVIRWRTQFKHHLTQEKGRFEIFRDYHLRVGEIVADSHPPVPVREMRFDTTEVGAAKACTVTELTPKAGGKLPGDLLAAIGLAPATPGLHEVEVYDSIYHPEKGLVLGGWAEPEAASRFQPGAVGGVSETRHRAIRVIRDYGMFDRRETPQFYKDVPHARPLAPARTPG